MCTIPVLLRGALLIAALAVPSFPRAGEAQLGPQPQVGWATFYTARRAGRRTASGERYDPRAFVAAHPTLPFGTRVRVTRLETGASVIVRVIDRGPARAERRRGDIIDLSHSAAQSLGFVHQGRTRVRLDVVAK